MLQGWRHIFVLMFDVIDVFRDTNTRLDKTPLRYSRDLRENVEKFRELSAAFLSRRSKSLSGSGGNESEEKDLSFANTYWP